jgi:hypothetical protein
MTRYLCIFLILLIAPNCSIAQSLSIDSSTLRASNNYLIKGLKARELNAIYKKQRHTDSVYIGELRGVIKSELSKNAECLDENHKIKKYSFYLTIYSIIVTLFLIT